jgi:hypothetical protein
MGNLRSLFLFSRGQGTLEDQERASPICRASPPPAHVGDALTWVEARCSTGPGDRRP